MLVRERVEILLTLAEGQTFEEAIEKLPDEYKAALRVAKHYVGGTDKDTHKTRALAWKTAAKHLAIHGSEQGHDYANAMAKGHKDADKEKPSIKKIQAKQPEPEVAPGPKTPEQLKREKIRHQVKMVRAARDDREFRQSLDKVKANRDAMQAKKAEKKKIVNPEAAARVKAALEKGAKFTPPSEIKKGPLADISKREKEAGTHKPADTAA